MNLFLTEDGVLKLGYYGLTTQAECYSIKGTDCDGLRFAPEVFEGVYGMKSDVWSFCITLVEMMGIWPCFPSKPGEFFYDMEDSYALYDPSAIQTPELTILLKESFQRRIDRRWSVSELLNVSVMRWRMMSSIHL